MSFWPSSDSSNDLSEVNHFLNLTNLINPLLSGVPFLYPLKASENRGFSGIFKGYKKGILGGNGLGNLLVLISQDGS